MAHRISDEVAEVLRSATCAGSTLQLNGQLDRKMYQAVNKVLELSGFKWNRKQGCHIAVKGSAAETLAAALDDGKIVDPKKEWDFFETPEDLADRMAKILDIQPTDLVLEPSAGGGRLVRAVLANGAISSNVFAIEAQPVLKKELYRQGYCCIHDKIDDFLTGYSLEKNGQPFEKIIMNPPFSAGQDISHCRHAYSLLKSGGRMV